MAETGLVGPPAHEQSLLPMDCSWQDNNDDLNQYFDFDAPNMTGTAFQYPGAGNGGSNIDPTLLGPSPVHRNEQVNGGFLDSLQVNDLVGFSGEQRDIGYGCDSSQASTVAYSERAESHEAPANPPRVKRTRKSRKKPLTEAEKKEKLQKKLARNSEAASKCRQKKKVREEQLQAEANRLKGENEVLFAQIEALGMEIGGLRRLTAPHALSPAMCICSEDSLPGPSQPTIQGAPYGNLEHSNIVQQITAGSLTNNPTASTAVTSSMSRRTSQVLNRGVIDHCRDMTSPVSRVESFPVAHTASSLPSSPRKSRSASLSQAMERGGSRGSQSVTHDSGISNMGTPPDTLKGQVHTPPRDEGYPAQDFEQQPDYFQDHHEEVKPRIEGYDSSVIARQAAAQHRGTSSRILL